MANESVSFDFTSRGADSLARDFKSTGDSAVLAANGARLLADSLEKERRAAQASASATLASARADKILADAEDEAIAKSVEERIAVEKAAAAKRKDAEASRLDAEATKRSAREHEALIGRLQNAGKVLGAGGILAGGAGALSLAGPLGGLGAAIGAFGAIAGPELSKISEAMQKTGKARREAFANFTPQEKQLANQVTNLKNAFHGVEASMAPLITDVVKVARAFLTNALPAFKLLADVGGRALETILGALGAFLKSPAFGQIAKQLGNLASQIVPFLATELVQLLKVFLQLFVQVGPAGIKLLQALLPAIVDIVTALTPLVVLLANVVAATVLWLQKNHLLIPALAIAGAAFITFLIAVEGASAPILAIVAAVAAVAAGVIYLAKHWRQVWGEIKSIAADAWSFISGGWHKYLFLGLYAIIGAVIYVVHHWSGAWRDIKNAVQDAWTFMRVQFDKMELLFLQWAKTLVHAAATAFGWVPGLGGKLKAADAALGRFVSSTEARLFGLTHKQYTVSIGLDLPQGIAIGTGGKGTTAPRAVAAGWLVPGTGNRDTVPAMLMPGEAVVPKRLVPSVAPFLKAGGVPGFAAGGPVGVSGGSSVLTVHLSTPSIAAMARVFGSTVAAIVSYVRSHARLTVPAFAGGGGAGGAGVARWAPVAALALRMLGQPAGDLGIVLSQMATESGGNPFVVNKWDSNWAAGTPSVGLMQVIGPTFASWAGPFRGTGPFEYGVSVNPLANVFAGLNYAIHRYGGAWTSVLGHGHGYDSGGYLPVGWSLAYNGTGRPEPVIPAGRGGGASTVINLHVSVGHGTHPVQAAREIAKLLNDGARSGVQLRRSVLSANG